jgi:hypothetical protein
VRNGAPCLEAFVTARGGIPAGREILLGLERLHPRFEGGWEPSPDAAAADLPSGRDSLSSTSSAATASSSSSILEPGDGVTNVPLTAAALEVLDHVQPPRRAPRVIIEPLSVRDAAGPPPRVFPKELHPLAGLPAIAAASGCRLLSLAVPICAPPPPPPPPPAPIIRCVTAPDCGQRVQSLTQPGPSPDQLKAKRPRAPTIHAKRLREPAADKRKRTKVCGPSPPPPPCRPQPWGSPLALPQVSIRGPLTLFLKDDAKRRRLLPVQL